MMDSSGPQSRCSTWNRIVFRLLCWLPKSEAHATDIVILSASTDLLLFHVCMKCFRLSPITRYGFTTLGEFHVEQRYPSKGKPCGQAEDIQRTSPESLHPLYPRHDVQRSSSSAIPRLQPAPKPSLQHPRDYQPHALSQPQTRPRSASSPRAYSIQRSPTPAPAPPPAGTPPSCPAIQLPSRVLRATAAGSESPEILLQSQNPAGQHPPSIAKTGRILQTGSRQNGVEQSP